MKEKYLFLDTNVFIDCKYNILKLKEMLNYSKERGWKFSISMYTLLELKANEKTRNIINFLCKNFSRISIIKTEIKGMDMTLYELKNIKKVENEKFYKKEKKEYEMKCIIYFCVQIGIIFKDIFVSEKTFKRKFEDLLKYRSIKTLEEDKKFVNEYLEKIIKEILLFYSGTEEIDRRIKQKLKSKKEKLKEELITNIQKSEIKNQSNFMIKVTLEIYLDMVYKKIFNKNEKIDKNNFFDILFINLVESKQMMITNDKWIKKMVKNYGYTEVSKYNEYIILGLPNVVREEKLTSEVLEKMWEEHIKKNKINY